MYNNIVARYKSNIERFTLHVRCVGYVGGNCCPPTLSGVGAPGAREYTQLHPINRATGNERAGWLERWHCKPTAVVYSTRCKKLNLLYPFSPWLQHLPLFRRITDPGFHGTLSLPFPTMMRTLSFIVCRSQQFLRL